MNFSVITYSILTFTVCKTKSAPHFALQKKALSFEQNNKQFANHRE